MKSEKIAHKFSTTLSAIFVALCVAAVIPSSARAQQDIYNNLNSTASYLWPLTTANSNISQEITMNSAVLAANPVLTSFSFEYASSTYNPSSSYGWYGNVLMDVQFYANNGSLSSGYPSPGTLMYDSGFQNIYSPLFFTGDTTNALVQPYGIADLYQNSTLEYPLYGIGNNASIGANVTDVPTISLPASDFTVVFTISGLAAGDNLSLVGFANPPSTGTNYGDYWVNTISGWELVTNVGAIGGLGMELQAAPEPSVVAMAALGGLLMTGLIRRRKV